MQRLLDDKGLTAVMVAAMAVAFAGYEWVRSPTDVPPQPIALSVLALAAVAYAAHSFVKLRRQLDSLRRGLEGEKVVGQFLESIRQPGWHVLHDIPGEGFNLDHVLCGRV